MFERELLLTEDPLRESGSVLVDLRGGDLGARQKRSQSDVVTAADVASERVMLDLLERRAPADGILSEECGALPGSSGDVWVIDPLDGTTNYASGLDEFGVIVGLTRNGAPIVGGMFFPATGDIYIASRGGGAFRNGTRVAVSSVDRVENAIFDHSLADLDEIREEQQRTLRQLIRSARGVRCIHSLTYIARIAEGTYDGFVYHSLGLWDICGPSVILEEAGARLTTIQGQPLDLSPSPAVATRLYAAAAANPTLLQDLLRVIASAD